LTEKDRFLLVRTLKSWKYDKVTEKKIKNNLMSLTTEVLLFCPFLKPNVQMTRRALGFLFLQVGLV
jgi:hypothetical protein